VRDRGDTASRPAGRRRRASPVLRAHVETGAEDAVATLEELAAAADLVVQGEVVDVRPGRLEDDGPGASRGYEEVAVHVHRACPAEAETSVVVFEQLASLDGFGVATLDGVERAAIGDRGLWFLRHDEVAPDVHQLVNTSQAQYLLDTASRVRRPVENRMVWPARNELAATLAGEPVDRIQAVVADAWSARPRPRRRDA
jgi:hypothetical protein